VKPKQLNTATKDMGTGKSPDTVFHRRLKTCLFTDAFRDN